MSLRLSMTTTEIDGLILIFTNYTIPALTTRPRLCEASLYFSEKLSVIAASTGVYTDGLLVLGASFMYKL
jgi:hypothetical protein